MWALILFTLFPYLNAFLNLTLNDGYGKIAHLCMELPIQEYQLAKMRIIPNTILYVIFLCSGIIFDYQMIVFVKNRNQKEPTELVPWKSVGSQDKVSEKMSCKSQKKCGHFQIEPMDLDGISKRQILYTNSLKAHKSNRRVCKKSLKKVFNWSEFHFSEVTSYTIHTIIWVIYASFEKRWPTFRSSFFH